MNSTFGSTVIIVEDDDSVRFALDRLLTKRGFIVLAYQAATEFLENLDPGKGDCIILDQNLPEMSGLELLKEISGTVFSKPVIFTTGQRDPELFQAAKAAGALQILEKPFRTSELLEAINSALAFEGVD